MTLEGCPRVLCQSVGSTLTNQLLIGGPASKSNDLVDSTGENDTFGQSALVWRRQYTRVVLFRALNDSVVRATCSEPNSTTKAASYTMSLNEEESIRLS